MSAFYSFLAVFGVLAILTVSSADDDIFTSKVLNDKEYYVGAFSKVIEYYFEFSTSYSIKSYYRSIGIVQLKHVLHMA